MRCGPALGAALTCAVCACSDVVPSTSPKVVATVAEAVTLASRLELKFTVSDCTPTKLEVFDRTVRLKELPNPGRSGTVVLEPSDLRPIFAARGISADFTLVAKVTCDDAKTADASAVEVRFLPTAASQLAPDGTQALPDTFVAEGGGGAAATFLGCVGQVQGGPVIERVSTASATIARVPSQPIACDFRGEFTPPSAQGGIRWFHQPGVGAFAFGADLQPKGSVMGQFARVTVGPDGDAVFESTDSTLRRYTPSGNLKWEFKAPGRMLAPPRLATDMALAVFTPNRSVVVGRASYANPGAAAPAEWVMAKFSVGQLVGDTILSATFSADGGALYFPAQEPVPAGAAQTSVVLACRIAGNGCSGPDRLWESAAVNGVVTDVVEVGGSGHLAFVASTQTTFVNASTGAPSSIAGPVLPTGALKTLAFFPSPNGAFYLLNGAPGALPVEWVALEGPTQGEVARFRIEGGGAPLSSVTMDVDSGGQAWLRVGPRLVKPLSFAEYRALKVANP